MIKFNKVLDSKGEAERRKYVLTLSEPIEGDITKEVVTKDENGNEVKSTVTEHGIVDWKVIEVIKNMDLIYAPGSNKYDNMLAFVEKCSEVFGKEFDDFYVGTIKSYLASNKDIKIIKDAIPNIIKFSELFIEKQNINFDDYIDLSKKSKNSIFFDASEIKEIVRSSCYLKLYYSIYKDMDMRISESSNREIFQILAKKLIDTDIVTKLYKIVSSKTYEYNRTDQYMWEFIKNLYCKTPDMHISHIFNFIINYIIITCEYDQNPIPYIISVIDESIKWILKSIYKESIIYSDAIATQDVTAVSGKDNLETYAHNNTIAALTVLAYQSLETIFENSDEKIEAFKNTIESIKEPSVLAHYITFPILSKITDIPYRHFTTLSVTVSYLLSMLLYDLLKGTEFETKYPTLVKILTFYNTQHPIGKTTYKLKNLAQFTQTFDSFLGFKNYTTAYDSYSSIIGKIVKNEYCSLINSNTIPNFPAAKLELEIVEFYNNYFSHGLDNQIASLQNRIDLMI